MIKGFYTGTTGAIEHQKMMDIAANNMANVNNESYKASNISFQELLYQRVRMPNDYESNKNNYDIWVRRNKGLSDVPNADEENAVENEGGYSEYYYENKLRAGTGARVSESGLVMTQGSFQETKDPLTAMIKGDAFFAIEDKNGNIAYTREGSFNLSLENDGLYLILPSGEYVLDENYNRIIVPGDIDREKIKFVSPSYGGNDEYAVTLGLFTCDNIYGLARVGGNKYIPSDFSGEMVNETRDGVDVISRCIEMSNVSIAEEMVKVIQAQRAFQTNLTVIRTADEIEAYTNQLRG